VTKESVGAAGTLLKTISPLSRRVSNLSLDPFSHGREKGKGMRDESELVS